MYILINDLFIEIGGEAGWQFVQQLIIRVAEIEGLILLRAGTYRMLFTSEFLMELQERQNGALPLASG
ncbi:hypothetical protein [Bacillus xiapuensis]|uniref:hypothetical protein n=1 Tax=Bacillus xiapuensis TaxID=2014075 RepID=UPI000C2416E5|nr:hypothetical protein [Bacillus xiapuensis]